MAILPKIDEIKFSELNSSKFLGNKQFLNKTISIYVFVDKNNYLNYRFVDKNIVISAINILNKSSNYMIVYIWQQKNYLNFARTILFEYLLPKYNKLYCDIATTYEGKNAIINVFKNINSYNCICGIYDLTNNSNKIVTNIKDLKNTWKDDNIKKLIYFQQK